MSNIHASYYQPRYLPIRGDIEPGNIDRAQGIAPSVSTNREELYEIGRDGKVGNISLSADVSYDLTQVEYGSIAYYQLLAGNQSKGGIGEDPITLRDFRTSYGDITAFLTDDDDVFKGTIHYPSLRLSSLGLSISSPEDVMERSFSLEGEEAFVWQGDNKYYHYQKHTCTDASDNTVTLDKEATEDPITGDSVYRVVQITAADGVSTELTSDKFTATTSEVTVNEVASGDIIKVYYTSQLAPDSDLWVPNDIDAVGLLGSMVSIYLFVPGSGKPSSDDYVYRLQSCDIDADLEREDMQELGNFRVVQRGVTSQNVNVSIERIVENFAIEEVLSGRGPDFGKLDINDFSDDISLIVKVYDSNAKDTFKYGIKCSGLTPSDIDAGADVEEYLNRGASLEGSNLLITEDESELGF